MTDLSYLKNLTDDFGIWQHNFKGQINKDEGYALDDVARGLIVYLLAEEKSLAYVCFNYLSSSLKDGRLVGFFDKDRKPIVYPSSQDAFALTYWAFAMCVVKDFHKAEALNLISKLDKQSVFNDQHLRPIAYSLIAASLLGSKSEADLLLQTLLNQYDHEWNWFEGFFRYANAILPYALLVYANSFKDSDLSIKEIFQKSLQTLEQNSVIGIIPAPIGNRMWHQKGQILRDIYGQQPIDAGFMVLMYCMAYKLYQESSYLERAKIWLSWFTGNNIFDESLINDQNGCADGIDENGVSENFGAESTIMYLWANLEYDNTVNK
jgi:hypothetical protein